MMHTYRTMTTKFGHDGVFSSSLFCFFHQGYLHRFGFSSSLVDGGGSSSGEDVGDTPP